MQLNSCKGKKMDALIKRIESEAVYLGNGIIKADSFINHQLDPELTREMGEAFAEKFKQSGISDATKIITAEVSGIAPALAVGMAMGLPVVFARKKRPSTMADELLSVDSVSHTKKEPVTLFISKKYLSEKDRVILIDDFLATGHTINAMVTLINKSGAKIRGIGCVIEKVFEKARKILTCTDIPVITLAKIDLDGEKMVVS